MEAEFVQLFISNMPNFVGLVLLSAVLWRVLLQWKDDSAKCDERFEKLLERVLSKLDKIE